MTTPDEPLTVLEIITPQQNVLELFTEPLAVLEVGTAGPAGPPGPEGPPGPVGFQFQGTWNPTTRYDNTDVVSWGRNLYVSNGSASVGIPPSSDDGVTTASGWYILLDLDALSGDDGKSAYDLWIEAGNTGTIEEFFDSLTGPAGPAGPPGGNFTDAWDSTRVYLPGDIVSWNGNLYVSTQTSEDFLDPSHPDYWAQISFGDTASRYTALLPAGQFVEVTHGLNSEYVIVQLRETASREIIYADIEIIDATRIQVSFGRPSSNPEDGTFRVTVMTDA